MWSLRQASREGAGRPASARGGPVATVAVDALGADRGTAEVAAGAVDAAASGIRSVLFGPEAELRQALGPDRREGVEVVDAPIGIGNDEEPARAVRAKENASIVQAAKALAAGRADAVVTAGSTGAALAAGLFHIKRLPGVHRPAVAVLLPVPGRPTLFLDAGANVEVRTEHLVQFAHMGAAFSEGVLGVERPSIGLLSIGEEPGKGTPQVVEAHEELRASGLEFVGNVEGGEVVGGKVDVVVTDGFTGNITLKAIEGTVRTVGAAMREAVYSGTLSKLGGLLLRPKLRRLREELDPETVGGAYLLGLRGLVVICHGGSSRRAIASGIELAARGVSERVVEKTAEGLASRAVGQGANTGEQTDGGGGSSSVNAVSVRARP
jgi:glycerol-3-phosphate acyltransferase PlsX